MVLDDGSSASLHCQDAGHLQDDVLGGSPACHLACQLYSDDLRNKTFNISPTTDLTMLSCNTTAQDKDNFNTNWSMYEFTIDGKSCMFVYTAIVTK